MSYTDRLYQELDNIVFDPDTQAKLKELIQPSIYTLIVTVIYGDPGSGKSYLIGSLVKDIGISVIDCQPNLSIEDFYYQLLDGCFSTEAHELTYQSMPIVYKRYHALNILRAANKTRRKNIIRRLGKNLPVHGDSSGANAVKLYAL